MNALARKAFTRTAWGVLILAAVLFLFRGTFVYWQGWVYLLLFAAFSIALTFYLLRTDPKLVERRLKAGPAAEKEESQKVIQTLASTVSLLVCAVSALDVRYGWSSVPVMVVLAGNVLMLLGFLLLFYVLRENSFASAVIEVAKDQQVISSGPYARVRHPMYTGVLLLFLGTPLALGSYWGLAMIPLFAAVLIARLRDEEGFLRRKLPGYEDYCRKVPWRLIPYVY